MISSPTNRKIKMHKLTFWELVYSLLCLMITCSAVYSITNTVHLKMVYIALASAVPILLSNGKNSTLKIKRELMWFYIWIIIYLPAVINIYSKDSSFLGISLANQAAFFITLIFIVHSAIYYKYQNSELLNKIAKMLMGVIVVDIIFSIVVLINNPTIIRSQAGANTSSQISIATFGVSDYSMVYALAIIFPIFLCKHTLIYKSKYLNIVLCVLIPYVIYISGLTTALLILIFGLTLTIVMKANKVIKYPLLLALVFLFVITTNTSIVSEWLLNLAGTVNNMKLSTKLIDIAMSLLVGETVGTVADRTSLYSISWNSFLSSPVIGMGYLASSGTVIVGDHASGLDILGMVGIIGFIPFVAYIYSAYNSARVEWKNTPYHDAMLICFLNALIMIFSKKILSSYAIFLVISFIIPVLPRYFYKKEEQMYK